MATTVLAWESSSWWWNDAAHAAGAFVTSPGIAGLAALAAALIAARQVYLTRQNDHLVSAKQEKDRHTDRLWTRFQWIAEHQHELGPMTFYRMIKAVEVEAEDADDGLHQLISQLRAKNVQRIDVEATRQVPETGAESEAPPSQEA